MGTMGTFENLLILPDYFERLNGYDPMAFKFDLIGMVENAAAAADAAAENVDQAMDRVSERIDSMLAVSKVSSDDNSSRQPCSLDADEAIIDSSDDATWVSFDELFLDELVLTNKRLICVWRESSGLFKPPTEKVHSFRLEELKSIQGVPAVQRVKHGGYHCLQVQFLNSVEYFSLDESPKNLGDQWVNKIRRLWQNTNPGGETVPDGRSEALNSSAVGTGIALDGVGRTSDDLTLQYSLVLERSCSRGAARTKTEFFVLDALGRKRYSIECINYEKASKDNHATLYDAAGAELGHIRTKERMKGQPDDEYLINVIGDGTQYHLRTAYLWERPKGNRLNAVYLLKPNKWLVILSIKEQFASIKASLRGEDVKVPMRIWDKNDLVMRITRRVSEHEYCCYEIETRSEGDYLLAMLITVATSCVLDHSEER